MIQEPGKQIAQGDTNVWKQGATAYAEGFGQSQQERDRYDAAKAATWQQLVETRTACRATDDGIKRRVEQIANAPADSPQDLRGLWEERLHDERRNLLQLQLQLQGLCERMATEFGEQHNADW